MLVKSSASILGDYNLKSDLKMLRTSASSFVSSKPLCDLLASHLQAASEPGHMPLVNLLTCSMVMNHFKDPKQTVCTVKKGPCKPIFV